jgi:hypothetical protein
MLADSKTSLAENGKFFEVSTDHRIGPIGLPTSRRHPRQDRLSYWRFSERNFTLAFCTSSMYSRSALNFASRRLLSQFEC